VLKVTAVDARFHFGRFHAAFGAGDSRYVEVVPRMCGHLRWEMQEK
jgi:hypothetical protein